MREQQFERVGIAHVERAPQRIRPAHPRAVFEQHARAGRMLHRVIQRFAVVRVGAGFQQHRGENRIAIDARRAVQRRQRPRFVGFGERRRRKRLPIRWFGSAPASSRRRAQARSLAANSGSCPSRECVTATSGGSFNAPPARAIQPGSAASAAFTASRSPAAHAMVGSSATRSGWSSNNCAATRGRGASTPPVTSPPYARSSQRRTSRALLPRQRMRFDERAEIGP